MTWTKSADDYPDRLLEISDAAYRLHHAATVYANRVGLDGRIPKVRLSLIPVPPRTRRPAVVRELVMAGIWEQDDLVYVLTDFFDAQMSAEEVACQRAYDAIRQRLRLAKSNEQRAVLKAEEDAAKLALFDARERRRARASHRDSQRDSRRPLPLRPVPSRSVPNESEDESNQPATRLGRVPADESFCERCGGEFRGENSERVVVEYGAGTYLTVHRACVQGQREVAV